MKKRYIHKPKFSEKMYLTTLFVLTMMFRGFAQSASEGNINIPSGGEMAIVNGQHNFQNGGSGVLPGIISTARTGTLGYLSFSGTASWVGAANNAHTDGYVRTYMTTSFTFPIGNGGKFRPAGVSTASAGNPADAAYFAASPTAAGYSNTAVGAGVSGVSNIEYWDINGATPASITLTWDASSGVQSASNVKIVGWNGTQWVNIPATIASGATPASGTITTSGTIPPSNYQVYTLAGLNDTPANGLVSPKVFLQGGLAGTSMTTTLATNNLIPLTDPYGKGTSTTNTVISGNGITDWVLVELRSAPGAVTESVAALLKSDGSIINADGSGSLNFTTTSGSFYVSVRHRNHLGVMTASPISISSTVTIVDFTLPSTATYGGTASQATIGSVKAMWAGNATGITLAGSDNVRYSSGDINAVTGYLTTQTGTAGGVKTNIYTKEDTNLDGIVRYSGGARDILPITLTISTNPNNASGGLGYIVIQSF